jgi:rare lipoprotein A
MKKLFIFIVILILLIVVTGVANAEKCTYFESGNASWYGVGDGCSGYTASGEPFNPYGMTCAYGSYLPFYTKLKVVNKDNGKSIIVTVLDRGAFNGLGRIIDLSYGAFSKLASPSTGVIRVDVYILKK